MLLRGGSVLLPEGEFRQIDLFISGRQISGFSGEKTGEELDISGCRVLPGLIDLHIHGYRGRYVMDADASGLRELSRMLAAQGVTSFLPTTVAASETELLPALSRLRDFHMAEAPGALPRGIYMEGPFLSPRFKGAMRPDRLRLPDRKLAETYYQESGGTLRFLAVAPELPEASELIQWCREREIQPAVAHSAAEYNQALHAMEAGADHVTHLFNAMADPRHRQPGIWGALLDCGATAELITDGYHVHPAFIRMAYRLLGEERLILVSDDTPLSGQGDGEYEMDGVCSQIVNGVCRLADGTINGNVQPLLSCVLRAASFGIPFSAAVRMASAVPARRLGIDKETGSIQPGKDADLLVLGPDDRVRMTLVRGRIAYSSGS